MRHRGFLQARSNLRPQMGGSRLRLRSCFLPAFSRPPPLMLMGRSLVSVRSTAPLRLRMDEALPSYREDDGDWCDHGALTSHVLQAGGPLSFITCTMTASRLPSFWDRSLRRSPSPALKSDHLLWNQGPARGSDPSLLTLHLNTRPVPCDLRTGEVWLVT